MEKIIELILESSYCVALTGAGISTLSGIRDFRGKNGIYKEVDADKIFDMDYFLHDPSYYYQAAKNFIYNLDEKTPGIVHTELARLESIGIIKSVITQNIDLLHTKAGSKKVIEIHGSPLIHECLKCGMQFDYETIAAEVQKGNVPKCKCGGVIKPDIVFFGEALDPSKLNAASLEASKADLMLVLGSSLVVQPAASLPFSTLENGGKLIIVNDSPTPLDSYAEVKLEDLKTTFELIKTKI